MNFLNNFKKHNLTIKLYFYLHQADSFEGSGDGAVQCTHGLASAKRGACILIPFIYIYIYIYIERERERESTRMHFDPLISNFLYLEQRHVRYVTICTQNSPKNINKK